MMELNLSRVDYFQVDLSVNCIFVSFIVIVFSSEMTVPFYVT